MKESLYFLFFGENMKQAVRYFKVLCGHSLQIKDSLIAITYKIFKYFLSGIIIVIFLYSFRLSSNIFSGFHLLWWMVQNESVLLSTDLSLQIDVLYRMYAITCIQDASLSFTCNRKKKCKEAHQSMSHWKCLLSCSTGRLILTAWNSLPGKKKCKLLASIAVV